MKTEAEPKKTMEAAQMKTMEAAQMKTKPGQARKYILRCSSAGPPGSP